MQTKLLKSKQYTLFIALLLLQYISLAQSGQSKNEKYVLIKTIKEKMEVLGKSKLYNVSVVDQKEIDRLNAPLKALATYYSGFAASDCIFSDSTNNVICNLTTALGLDYQGSDKQLAIIAKWFPSDKTAKERIKEKCWVGNPGSSQAYSDYSYLSFTVAHDTVFVQYKFGLYYHGKPSKERTDIALIKKDKIVFLVHAS